MINLSGAEKNQTLLDPFCGSGTVLTEAMLMNYKNLIGSDISPKAIGDTEKNIAWIKQHANRSGNIKLEVLDAQKLSTIFDKNSIGAIVTETYLGPQRGKVDIKKVVIELTTLYNQVLREMEIVLKSGGTIVLALPLFMPARLCVELKEPATLKKINSFTYGRAGQSVWREIIVLKKV